MRDILTDIFENQPRDPIEAARKSVRPKTLKRFYKEASVGAAAPYAVFLDGKPVKTPRQRSLAAPARDLAHAIAAEWNAQGDQVDPSTMPLTRLANVVIDAVADNARAVAQEIENYLGSDLVCYRAGEPAGLCAAQARAWDPVLAFVREKFGARFTLAEGVMHTPQPQEAIAAAAKAIPADPWTLAAVSTVTTLTGSALIALALSHGALSVEDAWAAAHVDEDWQMAQWGRDTLALERRDLRYREMQAAAKVLAARS
ncbi:MAG: ATPase [Pseudolabrys sp.]|nr:ATPase [Pseudolabrys sp.]MBV9956648.1 ATPase [Pseudolabrys sp.]